MPRLNEHFLIVEILVKNGIPVLKAEYLAGQIIAEILPS